MAKRGAAEHPKTRRLALEIGYPVWAALGLLENVWHWMYRYALDGALTPAALEDCAFHIRYEPGGEPLRHALHAAGWLDPLPGGQWFMHDWPEHADDSVHMALARKEARFANGAPPRLSRLPKVEQERLKEIYASQNLDPRTESAQKAHGTHTESAPPLPSPPSPSMPCHGHDAGGRRASGGDAPATPEGPLTPPPGYNPKLSPHRQQAADLWRDGGSQALFRWCGDVAGDAYQRWLDAAEAWLKAGLTIDLSFLERVTLATWASYQAKGSQGPKTLQWWLNTANDLAIQPPPDAPAPPPADDYWRRPTEIPQAPPRCSTPPPRDRGAAPASVAGLDVDAALRDGPGSEAWRQLPLAVRKSLRTRYDAQQRSEATAGPSAEVGGAA